MGDSKIPKTIKLEDGKEYEVVNTVTVMEIVAHKLENDQEIPQFIAPEFMMVDHKDYMVNILTKAILAVVDAEYNNVQPKNLQLSLTMKYLTSAMRNIMKGQKRENLVKVASKAMLDRLRKPRIRDKITGGR